MDEQGVLQPSGERAGVGAEDASGDGELPGDSARARCAPAVRAVFLLERRHLRLRAVASHHDRPNAHTARRERWGPSTQAAGVVSNSFVATAGNSNFSTPVCNSTTARSGITSVEGWTTSRIGWGCEPVCSIVLPSAFISLVSLLPKIVMRCGSMLTSSSVSSKPTPLTRTLILSLDSDMETETGHSSSHSARNQSSKSCPCSPPRASNNSCARRAIASCTFCIFGWRSAGFDGLKRSAGGSDLGFDALGDFIISSFRYCSERALLVLWS